MGKIWQIHNLGPAREKALSPVTIFSVKEYDWCSSSVVYFRGMFMAAKFQL